VVAANWQLTGRSDPAAPAQTVAVAADPFVVGRRPESHLALVNPTVSGRHAELAAAGAGLLVRDLGSTNGTFVNGARVADAAPLRDGDVVQFGTARYTLARPAASAPQATLAAAAADHALTHVLFDRLLGDDRRTAGVVPYFQPIVGMGDFRPVGVEVLARSNLMGLETPAAMFKVAAERNQEAELSDILRREALRVARGVPGLGAIYLNTHPSEVGEPELLLQVEQLRREHPDRRLVLEIHEAAAASTHRLAELRKRLIELGVGLAYDDFGAGQSRLLELVDVPPDVIKFDMNLIRGLPSAPEERRRLVASLVRVVRDLGVAALAEGIETPEEAQVCRELGFGLAQGYLFGRPAALRPRAASVTPSEPTPTPVLK
jgi:EAL domain-containing protein (putative c-di-GMP-specific phosphodiesterase class I)